MVNCGRLGDITDCERGSVLGSNPIEHTLKTPRK